MSRFDEIIDRENTKSEKFDFKEKHGVPKDVIPLWVADMDFKAPDQVIEALTEAVNHGIFGYSGADDAYYDAVLSWMNRHYNYFPDKEELVVTPGVVFAIAHAIKAFTKPGDEIVIQEPVYYPFKNEIEANNRNVVVNKLKEEHGEYTIDFEDLEKKLINGNPKLLILSNPHNPVGRVFTEEELTRLIELCRENDVLIISDEIHADFVFGGRKHRNLATLGQEVADNVVICTSPSKTFNLAGLQVSNIFIKNPAMRERFKKELRRSGAGSLNRLAYVAGQAAYNGGEEWLSELKDYLEGNFEFISTYLRENIPQIKANIPEGTYLVWLDCRDLGLSDEELKDLFLNKAKIWLDEGTLFGEGGSGFMRLNAASPRSVIKEALENLKEAVQSEVV